MLRACVLSLGLALLLIFGTGGTAWAEDFQVGDQVQAYNVDWYDATVLEVGSGNYDGYYLVKWDDFSGQQYIAADNIRPRPGAGAPGPSANSAAVQGRYVCYGYPGPGGQFRWYLEITDSTYAQQTPDLPAGHYAYDGADSAIRFVDGPYADNGWFGRLDDGGIVLRATASEQQGPRVDEYANIYCSK